MIGVSNNPTTLVSRFFGSNFSAYLNTRVLAMKQLPTNDNKKHRYAIKTKKTNNVTFTDFVYQLRKSTTLKTRFVSLFLAIPPTCFV